jgi:hypothetical protein
MPLENAEGIAQHPLVFIHTHKDRAAVVPKQFRQFLIRIFFTFSLNKSGLPL